MKRTLISFDYHGNTYIGPSSSCIDEEEMILGDYLVWKTSDLVERGMGFLNEKGSELANYEKIVKTTYRQAEKDKRLIQSEVHIIPRLGVRHIFDNFDID